GNEGLMLDRMAHFGIVIGNPGQSRIIVFFHGAENQIAIAIDDQKSCTEQAHLFQPAEFVDKYLEDIGRENRKQTAETQRHAEFKKRFPVGVIFRAGQFDFWDLIFLEIKPTEKIIDNRRNNNRRDNGLLLKK